MRGLSLLERFRELAASSGKSGGGGGGALVQPAESDFLARVAPVTRLLKETGEVLERGKRSKTSHAWDEESGGAAVEELRLVEGALGDAASCLALLRKGLWKEDAASEQHREHYEAIVRALERRKEALGVAVFQQKTQRLAEMAARNSVARAKLVELRHDGGGGAPVATSSAPLYPEDDPAVPRYELTPEEQQELARENADLQLRMMDSVVDAAQEIQRQLSELSAMMTQFSLEISVQNEEMSSIVDAVTKATLNVERGNQSLIEASSTSADFRFFVLLFLTVITLSLLFLHWYSN